MLNKITIYDRFNLYSTDDNDNIVCALDKNVYDILKSVDLFSSLCTAQYKIIINNLFGNIDCEVYFNSDQVNGFQIVIDPEGELIDLADLTSFIFAASVQIYESGNWKVSL